MDEVECSRQLAESVPLRGPDYVNPIAAVVEQWLTREAARLQPSPSERARRPRKGPLKLSEYDEEESISHDPLSHDPLSLPDTLPEFPPRSTSTVDQSFLSQSSPGSFDPPVDHSAPVSSSIPVVPQVVVDFLHRDSLNTVDSTGSTSEHTVRLGWFLTNT